MHGPVTRSRGKLLEKIGSLISLSNRSVTIADSEEIKSRTSTKGGKKRQKRARSPSRSASLPPQKVLHTLSTISEGFEGKRPSVSRTGSSNISLKLITMLQRKLIMINEIKIQLILTFFHQM